MNAAPMPATRLATIADLKDGQWAALFPNINVLQRVRYIDPGARGCYRVEWDHGRGTKAHVRVMPGSNSVQISL